MHGKTPSTRARPLHGGMASCQYHILKKQAMAHTFPQTQANRGVFLPVG